MQIHSESDNFVSDNLSGYFENRYLKNANFSCVDTEKQIHTFDTNVP